MVRAILEGHKTQTRRIVKGQMDDWCTLVSETDIHGKDFWIICGEPGTDRPSLRPIVGDTFCTYGQPGDRLWVRETWMPDMPRDGTWDDVPFFGCANSPLSMIPERLRKASYCLHRATWTSSELVGWKPSIHMPRWASRILLEIVSVRVERLQDISEADAIAEGCDDAFLVRERCQPPHSKAYRYLWEAINGNGSWDTNPWVWVVEFKRVEAAQ